MRVCAVARASEERAEGRAALLDRFSPSLPGDPQDPRPGEEPPEPYEYATVCEVQHALWPLLATVRHTGIALVRLSLTSPNEGTILADGASFAAEIGARSGEGAFLVRDLGPAHGRNHFYGFTLSHDEEHPRKRWCAITQAYGRLVKSNVATGWWGEPAEAYRNVEGMLRYAFKAWPAEYGRRSVAGDVLASGVISAPWMVARAILLGSPPSLTADPRKASAKRWLCQRCGRDMPAEKHAHSKWCSNRCKSGNWEDRHPGRHRGGPTTPGNPPEDPG